MDADGRSQRDPGLLSPYPVLPVEAARAAVEAVE
jgi:hypothetical protein